jgi:hypothetical protein
MRLHDWLIIIAAGVIAAGCAQPISPATEIAPTRTAPLPVPTTESPQTGFPEGQILFERITDKRHFTGTVQGQGDTLIILANMSSGSERQWDPFVNAVDSDRFTTLTFSYLGSYYGDAMAGAKSIMVRAREAGYARVICLGASLGVSACAALAGEPETIGMVMIAGPGGESAAEHAYPRLYVSGADDPWAEDIQDLYDEADDPRTLKLFDGIAAHGTDMFNSAIGEEFLALLVDFVNTLL